MHLLYFVENDDSFHNKLRISTRDQDLSGFLIRFLVFLLVIEYTLKVLSVLSNVVIENWGSRCKVENPLATLVMADCHFEPIKIELRILVHHYEIRLKIREKIHAIRAHHLS